MKRNCNLTLRLLPPCSNHCHRLQEEPIDEVDMLGEEGNQNNQNKQITFFYDGKISVSEITDTQAKAIIKLASEESYLPSPSGLSMKRSLQRFLQTRKHRIQTTSPYHH